MHRILFASSQDGIPLAAACPAAKAQLNLTKVKSRNRLPGSGVKFAKTGLDSRISE